MRNLFLLLSLLLSFSLSAQDLETAYILADSAEFLIYEDLDLDEAQLLNQQAALVFVQQNDYEGQVRCQINEATLYAQKDSFNRCLQLLTILEDDILTTKISDSSALAGRLYAAKAWSLWGVADYENSYTLAIQAAAVLKKHKNWERFVDASLIATYAIYNNNASQFSTIDKHIKETYEIALQYLPQSRLVFKFIYQLYGSILYQQGRIDQAIHLTQEGLKHQYQLLTDNHFNKDSAFVAKYYSHLGRLFSEKNDIEQAISYYKNAFSFYETLDDYPELVKLCARIGDLYLLKENEDASDAYYSRLPQYLSYLPNNPILQKRNNTFKHISMAMYYEHFHHHDSTLDYYNKHIHFIRAHNLAIDKAYVNIGTAFEAQGRYDKAEQYFLKALTVLRKKYGQRGTKMATIFFRLGNLAAENDDNTLAIAYMDSVIHLLNANVVSTDDKIEFLEYLLDKSIALEAFHHRGDVQMKEGRLHKAHADFKNVILLANYLRDRYTDSDSKLVSINKLRPVYEKAASAAWHLHEKEKDAFYKNLIFDYAEHSKSTLLNENILKFRNSYSEKGVGLPKALLQQEERFIAEIDHCKEHIIDARREADETAENHYYNQLLHLEQRLDSFEQALQASYPNYRSWDHGRDSMVAPKSVQAHLKSDELFIEYFISNQHFFVIYISKEAVKIKEIPNYNPRAFKNRLRNLRRTISNIKFILEFEQEAYTIFCEEAHWAFNTLLNDELLAGKKHLIIVPDRNLNYIPFEVLLTQEPKNKKDIDYHDLHYLIRDYSIHYEYSAAVMVNTQHRPNTTNGRILGFAATYGEQNDFDQLPAAVRQERTYDEIHMHNVAYDIPGTVEELEELSHHFHGDFFIGKSATERTFKEIVNKNEYSVIHLAMHGVVDYENPAYSCLMFTEDLDSLEDNLLYVYETQHLNGAHANLVVLSACKTGYGKYAQGEGIISLGRSFMYAGIPSIVMTLWELNDQTSVEVMELFYDNLVAGKTKDLAMQQAKLSYLDNNDGFTAHPFFWASFVSIGNQQAIPLEYVPHTWYWWLLGAVVLIGIFLAYRKFKF